MTDPESTSLLRQAEAATIQESLKVQPSGLDYGVTTDGKSVTGEAAVSHTADRWWVRAWAKVTARRGGKPQTGAGITGAVRWLRGKR